MGPYAPVITQCSTAQFEASTCLSPSNTPVPPAPTTTPVPPALTVTPTVPVATSPPPPSTATVTATPQAASAAAPLLSFSLPAGRAITGQMLAVKVHTQAHAQVTGILQVTTIKMVMTGTGKKQKRVKQTLVLYTARIKGTADAHGQFTGRVHITFRPKNPIQATLTIRVHTGRSTTRIAHVTIQALPVVVSVSPRVVGSGHELTVTVHTAGRARVVALVQVLTTRTIVTGRGKQRTKVTHVVVLYQLILHGNATAHGQFTGHARVTYKPSGRVQAGLVVTAQLAGTTSSGTAHVTLKP
jgi:hypothetical protein